MQYVFLKIINLFGIHLGKIGPYFINTHFVYGTEKEATNFLGYIDNCLLEKDTLPKKVFTKSKEQYENNEIYKNVIDAMVSYIKENINLDEIDYISGGERRDWFFSNIIANIIEKPHITIFKDLSTLITDSNFNTTLENLDLNNKKVLHIADLITVASSYKRAWSPAIEALGAKINWSLVVVDRMQGGDETLNSLDIQSFSLAKVDTNLFKKAFDMKLINQNQLTLLENFFINPDNTMRNFLINNPEFITNSLNSDEKTKKRATLLVDNDLYNLK